jgi:hypothetical protein
MSLPPLKNSRKGEGVRPPSRMFPKRPLSKIVARARPSSDGSSPSLSTNHSSVKLPMDDLLLQIEDIVREEEEKLHSFIQAFQIAPTLKSPTLRSSRFSTDYCASQNNTPLHPRNRLSAPHLERNAYDNPLTPVLEESFSDESSSSVISTLLQSPIQLRTGSTKQYHHSVWESPPLPTSPPNVASHSAQTSPSRSSFRKPQESYRTNHASTPVSHDPKLHEWLEIQASLTISPQVTRGNASADSPPSSYSQESELTPSPYRPRSSPSEKLSKTRYPLTPPDTISPAQSNIRRLSSPPLSKSDPFAAPIPPPFCAPRHPPLPRAWFSPGHIRISRVPPTTTLDSVSQVSPLSPKLKDEGYVHNRRDALLLELSDPDGPSLHIVELHRVVIDELQISPAFVGAAVRQAINPDSEPARGRACDHFSPRLDPANAFATDLQKKADQDTRNAQRLYELAQKMER